MWDDAEYLNPSLNLLGMVSSWSGMAEEELQLRLLAHNTMQEYIRTYMTPPTDTSPTRTSDEEPAPTGHQTEPMCCFCDLSPSKPGAQARLGVCV